MMLVMLKRLFRIKVVTFGHQANLMHLEEHISTLSVQNLISVQKYCQGLLNREQRKLKKADRRIQ